MIEFDGEVKYGRLLKPGEKLEDVIRAERDREKLLQGAHGHVDDPIGMGRPQQTRPHSEASR